MSSARLLQLALPLVKTHGFTREALSRSVLSLPTPLSEPLCETALSALFGEGDGARRTLIEVWLDDARDNMQSAPTRSLKGILNHRLKWNEPVLQYLPEAFSLLATQRPVSVPIDPTPAIKHCTSIADQACYLSGDTTVGLSWYARRGSIAAAYAAAELHQLKSPETAYHFLNSLLDWSFALESSLNEAETFSEYTGRSWAGIIHSRGIF
ncbi:uncharacterized protein LAESUDRAFT_739175 [Laetiporus sulphureus 93-53]|uniref:Ubiquinone biosynthesis protein n=1 Tax=Laetiporus sulphureus 93-53 TaxID=1314785 RepID=A0A165BNS6_9APHY|nr:uncharacterized protein LAESUDRAFT_739175 [Laetiporus sulphureus 93-53]KZT01379.1 hypothetical protein LAESUDRAFT_739175 [Laetiporus sulphureus 93-53]